MFSENLYAFIGIYHSEAAGFVPFFVVTHLSLDRVRSWCDAAKKEGHEKNMNIACYF